MNAVEWSSLAEWALMRAWAITPARARRNDADLSRCTCDWKALGRFCMNCSRTIARTSTRHSPRHVADLSRRTPRAARTALTLSRGMVLARAAASSLWRPSWHRHTRRFSLGHLPWSRSRPSQNTRLALLLRRIRPRGQPERRRVRRRHELAAARWPRQVCLSVRTRARVEP
jgi:hypothetical protein